MEISVGLVLVGLIESSYRIPKISVWMVKWHSHIRGSLVTLGRKVVFLVIKICWMSQILVNMVTLGVSILWRVQISLRIGIGFQYLRRLDWGSK